MGVWDRFTLVLDVILGLVLALLAIVIALHPAWALHPPWGPGLVSSTRWVLGAVGVAWALLSLRLLVAVFGRGTTSPKVHQTELGEVRVSLGAVENLVMRVVLGSRGIREARVSVVGSDDAGVSIRIKAGVTSDVNIPEVSEEVEQAIRGYLRTIVGLEARQIAFLVSDIGSEPRRGRVS